MSLENYQRLYELETTPEALAATCRYLEERFRKFLKKTNKNGIIGAYFGI